MSKILIIDDSRLSVSALQNILSTQGHTVVGTAYSGEDGINKAKELKPEVICLDFVMPDIDGKETALKLRSSGVNSKIVMITQNEVPQNLRGEIQAAAYVIKPITANKIQEAFSTL